MKTNQFFHSSAEVGLDPMWIFLLLAVVAAGGIGAAAGEGAPEHLRASLQEGF
jgi:hypothetical protein